MSHYCHVCGRYLANERFTGKGHARHICKGCQREQKAHRKEILKEKRAKGLIPEVKQKPVSPEVIEYVEREIIPQYQDFDTAHQEDHVRMVIEHSLKLAEHNPAMNTDMVYLIAAFHDLGLVNGRENHHKDSRKILEANPFIKSHFKQKQIVTIGRAVEDHRASSGHKPRNGYGMIVAEADRFIEPETIIRRTIQYGLSHYPELDTEGHYQRTILHLREKYGPNGYLKVWVPWSDNARRLKDLHRLIADEKQIREMFNRLFEEETKQ